MTSNPNDLTSLCEPTREEGLGMWLEDMTQTFRARYTQWKKIMKLVRQVASDEFCERSDNAVSVSTCSLHVSCGRGFVAGGHIHVPSRVPQNRGSSPYHGGRLLCRICCTPVALMVVAFSLLVVDVTYFVDQPNFVLLARSISRNVLQLRLLAPLLFFLCIWGVGTKLVWSSHLHTFTLFRRGKDVGWSGVSFRRT